jgi:hypothetical protein
MALACRSTSQIGAPVNLLIPSASGHGVTKGEFIKGPRPLFPREGETGKVRKGFANFAGLPLAMPRIYDTVGAVLPL